MVFFWFSVVYVIILLFLMIDLWVEFGLGKELVGMFIVIWINDIMVYVLGRFFGKIKLFECILLKKIWEGIIGGVLFLLMVGVVWSIFVFDLFMDFWIVVLLLVVVSVIFGDFFEFFVKC